MNEIGTTQFIGSEGRSPVSRVRAGLGATLRRLRLVAPSAYSRSWEPRDEPPARFPDVISQACSAAQIASPEYARWCEEMHQPVIQHRKQWEWCYILQALHEAGVLQPGARGLGFGVGTEPITALLASRGCELVATDLGSQADDAARWQDTDQHADGLDDLNRDGICAPDEFRSRVTFRSVDMNDIPADLQGFDFTWSSCAMEHLGDLTAGAGFFERQLECLRPGGVGVHTTEYNVGSNHETVVSGHTVAYRRRDLQALVRRVREHGHSIDITFALGADPADRHVDVPPWSQPHLKIRTWTLVLTSFGLMVRRCR